MSVTVTVTRVILEELTSQSYLIKGVLAIDITLEVLIRLYFKLCTVWKA